MITLRSERVSLMNKKLKNSLVIVLAFTALASFAFAGMKAFSKYMDNDSESVKVSVIIPVYNTEKYLDETLNCVQDQTFKNMEIICVNDGSKDNSLNILKKHARKDSRIKIIDKENGGVSIARNTAMKNAKGKYIAFLDSDDLLAPYAIDEVYNLAEKYDADVTQYASTTFKDGEKLSEDVLEYKEPSISFKTRMDNENPFDHFGMDCSVVWNKLWKRSMIMDNNLEFVPGAALGEDTAFCWFSAPQIYKFVTTNSALHHYRVERVGSAMATGMKDPKKLAESYLKLANGMVESRNKISFKGSDGWIVWRIETLLYDPVINCMKDKKEKARYCSEILKILDPFIKKYKIKLDEKVKNDLNEFRQASKVLEKISTAKSKHTTKSKPKK